MDQQSDDDCNPADFHSASSAASQLQASVCNLLSMQSITSSDKFYDLLQTLNRKTLISLRFSNVLSDLNRASAQFPGTFIEQFALACGSEILNTESCWLGLTTLMSNVRRLRGKCDVQALMEVATEFQLMLSERDCRRLVELYQKKQGLLGA